MEKLAEERKGPSSMEYKKRQMLAALQTSVQVHAPFALLAPCLSKWLLPECCRCSREQCPAMTQSEYLENVHCARET